MAHAQKPDFVFPWNGRVHLNRWGRQFSRLLAAEVRASAWVMLDIPRLEVAWEYWLPTPFAIFPFTSPPVRHRMPPGSERALPPHLFKTAHCKRLLSTFHHSWCRMSSLCQHWPQYNSIINVTCSGTVHTVCMYVCVYVSGLLRWNNTS